MTTKTITVRLSPGLAEELGTASQDFLADIIERGLRELRVDRALEQYRQGNMSFGATAQQAGVTESELARYAYARGMEPPYSQQTLAEELS
jgi:predicted HTH domain antitoxin